MRVIIGEGHRTQDPAEHSLRDGGEDTILQVRLLEDTILQVRL